VGYLNNKNIHKKGTIAEKRGVPLFKYSINTIGLKLSSWNAE
jgi:hypothetical protein